MNHPVRLEQAHTFASLLPKLLRRLTAGQDDPVMELPLAQLRVCGILCEGPRPISALSRELCVSVSAMTQIADRLERARLVKREPLEGDRRVRCLRLTNRGEKMMRQHDEARAARMAKMLEHLTPQERRAAADALQSMIRAAAAAAGGQNGNGAPHNLDFPSSRILP
jgi:DNA-binding MarR family transcriptional regulator